MRSSFPDLEPEIRNHIYNFTSEPVDAGVLLLAPKTKTNSSIQNMPSTVTEWKKR